MPKDEQVEKRVEYRVCWAASSNVTFKDEGEWHPANPGETAEEVEESLSRGGRLSDGMEIAINESGFEWWVETREVADA